MINYSVVVARLVSKLELLGIPVDYTVTENDIVLKIGKISFRQNEKPMITDNSYERILEQLALYVAMQQIKSEL